MSVPDHSAEWRRALKMLADLPEGSTEALLLAHGFTPSVIAGLVDTGLATSTTEPILAGGRSVEVTRIRITCGAGAASKAAGAMTMPSARYRGPPMTSSARPHLTGRAE